MIKNRNIALDAAIDPNKILGGVGHLLRKDAKMIFVDGDSGDNSAGGRTVGTAKATIQGGVDAASAYGVVKVFPKKITDYTGDPTSYAETVIIPYSAVGLTLSGVDTGRTQGGLPQIKKGSGATAHITVRAPGVLIENMGINGISATGGGILLDDDYAAKSAFGTTIRNCHIKNCVGSTATNGLTGGGIMWSAEGNAWQTSIVGNMFYKNVADIVLMGTSNTRPQDILIQGNEFKSAVTSACDGNILCGGSGFQTITIDSNVFGDLPALGSGTNVLYMDLTGTLGGMVSNNIFGCEANATGTALTFKAAGTGANIPTTVYFCNNVGQGITDGESGELSIA